jgi:mannosyltransferase OCH1-like enzyme
MQSSTERSQQIPGRYHFVWFGTRFPTSNRIAIESCLKHCRGGDVTLWHSDDLSQHASYQDLLELGVRAERLDESLFELGAGAVAPFDVARLKQIWRCVASHISRSNLARAIVLYRFGGIYLDMDVLVVRSFDRYRHYPAFVGSEHIVWPGWALRGPSVQRFVRSPLLDLLRKLTVALPEGERLFQRTARWYPKAVNSAVLGAAAGHAFIAELLRRTAEVPEREWSVKHRLGTHVLQRSVEAYTGADLMILPPEAFYPLGPEVSRHYFRRRARPDLVAQRILRPETSALHWYSSLSDITAFSPEELRELEQRTVYGHLCAEYITAARAARSALPAAAV